MISSGIVLILFVTAALLFVVFKRTDKQDVALGSIIGFGVAIVIGLIVLACNTITYVPANSVAIITSWGQPVGNANPGIKFKMPWEDVEAWSTTVQTMNLDGDSRVDVKFKGDGTNGSANGWANAQVGWHIADDQHVQSLWRQFTKFDNLQNSLVHSTVVNAFVVTFGNYTPEEALAGQNNAKIMKDITDDLKKNLGVKGIIIDYVNIKKVDPSATIQDRINKQVEAEADVTRAKIEQEKARIQNETAQLSQQALSDAALKSKCLEIVNTWDKNKNGDLPATFNCGFGNGQVLVGAK